MSKFFKRISLLVSVVFGMAACTTPPPPVPPDVTPPPIVAPPPAVVPPPGVVPPPVKAVASYKPGEFALLPGWESDDLREVWPAWRMSCEVLIKRPDWKDVCTVAQMVDAGSIGAIKTFFETYFSPYQIINPDGTYSGMVTGYYEPLLLGSRKRGGVYQTPLHRVPDDLLTIDLAGQYPELKGMRLRGRLAGNKVVPYWTREEMMRSGSLAGKELLWVDDPIAAFFLQVQGSGRVQLAGTKEIVRVAYADQNGHPYRSIGRYLVANGELTLDRASAQGIKGWAAANPARRQELLNVNPSYVFFKEEKIADPGIGPKGALGVPLTTRRSIAIDPTFHPLGAPVYLATTMPNSEVPLQRMMVAQDTGGAIRGAVRADFFWGFGDEAGEQAGRMKQSGLMWLLLPKTMAVPGTAN